jgi:hypothetical protein
MASFGRGGQEKGINGGAVDYIIQLYKVGLLMSAARLWDLSFLQFWFHALRSKDRATLQT